MKKVFFLTSILPIALFTPALASEEVRVYSGRHYNTDRQVYKKFSDQTGIKVRLIEASGISLVQRLKSEGKNTKADVIILVDAARINNAANAGLFAPIQSSSLEKSVPSRYRDPNNRWFGLTRRVRAIIVNPTMVSPSSVMSYSQLASPSLKGKVCLRKRKNVYNQSLVADQLALNGTAKVKSWLKSLSIMKSLASAMRPTLGFDLEIYLGSIFVEFIF